MGKGKPGPRYTPAEAEARLQIAAKRVALEAVDLVIALDKYPISSYNIERRVWSLTGQVGNLSRMCHVIWKYEALVAATTRKTNRD